MSDEDEISDNQWKANYIIQVCSASLSIIGSTTLVFKIPRDRAQNGSMTPYDRMILCLSSCDILSSITLATDQFLFRSTTDVWAFGTPATCQARAFLLQLAPLWTIWYNGLLSYYFLLTVLSQMRRQHYVQTFESWLHISGLFFPITAIMGLIFGWYPEDDPCRITDETTLWIVTATPLIFVLLSIIINYSTIYIIVRKSLRSTEHVAGPMPVQTRIRQEATIIMFLYVTAFLATVTPSFILAVLETHYGYTGNESNLYPLWVLNAILLPLQGLFNFLIYIKAAYSRFRAANKKASMCFVLHQALFNAQAPRIARQPRIAIAMTEHYVGAVTDGSSKALTAVHNRRNAILERDGISITDFLSDVEDEGTVHPSMELFCPYIPQSSPSDDLMSTVFVKKGNSEISALNFTSEAKVESTNRNIETEEAKDRD